MSGLNNDSPPPYKSIISTSISPDAPPPPYSEIGEVQVPICIYENATDSATIHNEQGAREKVLLHQSTKSQRKIFVRHVYAILVLQWALILVVSIGLPLLIPQYTSFIEESASDKFWVYWICGTFFVTRFETQLIKDVQLGMRKPVNIRRLIVLMTVTDMGIWSILVARIGSLYFIIELGIVIGICCFVVIFTHQNRVPFTLCYSFFYVLILNLGAFGILCLLNGEGDPMRSTELNTSYMLLRSCALISAPFLVTMHYLCTTWGLVKDKTEAVFTDEYIYGAVACRCINYKKDE